MKKKMVKYIKKDLLYFMLIKESAEFKNIIWATIPHFIYFFFCQNLNELCIAKFLINKEKKTSVNY